MSAPRVATQAFGNNGGNDVDSPHGDNVPLRELIGSKGDAYARDKVVFALLEYWTLRELDALVHEREGYWKQVLLSRKFGLNRN
jgi:hypothetical protein